MTFLRAYRQTHARKKVTYVRPNYISLIYFVLYEHFIIPCLCPTDCAEADISKISIKNAGTFFERTENSNQLYKLFITPCIC